MCVKWSNEPRAAVRNDEGEHKDVAHRLRKLLEIIK